MPAVRIRDIKNKLVILANDLLLNKNKLVILANDLLLNKKMMDSLFKKMYSLTVPKNA